MGQVVEEFYLMICIRLFQQYQNSIFDEHDVSFTSVDILHIIDALIKSLFSVLDERDFW